MIFKGEAAAKVTISGAFECRDKDGVLLKTIEFKSESLLPLGEAQALVESMNAPENHEGPEQ